MSSRYIIDGVLFPRRAAVSLIACGDATKKQLHQDIK